MPLTQIPPYVAADARYDGSMPYRRSGCSGVLLPEISLGLWRNFGADNPLSESMAMLHYAFDHGITHFDLANNYGPPYGTAEETFGLAMARSFAPYRDEMFISTKAGYDMWPGPYGNWGSRKYLMASLDQSLRRMGLDYVDLFYSHRFDPRTPMDETLQALVDIVRQGKALYVGISRWPVPAARYAFAYLKEQRVPCLIYQGRYNIFDRAPERDGVLQLCAASGVGFIGFSPLAQGLLTDRYLHGMPADSRMAKGWNLHPDALTASVAASIAALNGVAADQGCTLAQMALRWILADKRVSSVIVGASSVAQLASNIDAARMPALDGDALRRIDAACGI